MANLHGWVMSQQWPANGFKWVKNASQFNKDFKKAIMNDWEEYFLKADVQYPEKLHDLPNNWHFSLQRIKIEKVRKRTVNLHD